MPVAKSRLECLQICKLLQCVNEKNNYQIEKLVTSGVPHLINYNEPNEGDTPLIVAAVANDDEMIKFLISLGAHPDVLDFEGRSAAMRAAEYGHVQCFESLAKGGADMKLTDTKGRGVLFYCISSTERHARCMELALEHLADVNNRAKDGRTAFYAACETAKDNEATCMALIRKGANCELAQSTGRTPLMACAANGSSMVAREIVRNGVDVNEVDKYRRTAAHEAARAGNFDVLLVLAGNKANFDVYDSKQNNPIHFASKAHGMCVKFLGQRGCNPKVKNAEGELPKSIAKDAGAKECMRELRKVEKTFGKVGKDNEPWALALYDWVNDHSEEFTQTCQKYDPDLSGMVSQEDLLDTLKNMDAPLAEEVVKKVLPAYDKEKDGRFDYKDFVLAKKYVNKNYMLAAFQPKKKKGKKGGKGGRGKKKGKPPMDICVLPSELIMRTLDGGPPIMYIPKHSNFTDNNRFSAEDPPQHPLQDDSFWYLNQPDRQFVNMNDSAKHGDIESIKHALQQGYSIDTRDRYYKTPLMVACNHGNLEVAKALIEYGANVNAKDNFHWTSLHHAAHSGMIDVVELLVNNGANIDAVAMNGATPLFRAIEASRINVVEFLIKNGAKVQLENRKGATPMDASYFWADPRVLQAVKAKLDTLPAPADKKKGARPKTAPGSGKSKTGARGESAAAPPPPPQPSTPPQEVFNSRRRASIIRAASALARGINDDENIEYTPRKPWISQPNTQHLLSAKELQRERFGWEIDFPSEFQSPFNQNVQARFIMMGGEDG